MAPEQRHIMNTHGDVEVKTNPFSTSPKLEASRRPHVAAQRYSITEDGLTSETVLAAMRANA